MSDDSTAAVEHLDVAAAELRAAAGGLLWHVKSAGVDDLYRAGGNLTVILGALAEIGEHLSSAASHLADTRVLRDDADEDPAGRVAQARQYLDEVAAATRTAVRSASAYHSAVGHIAVEADLNAAPDDA
jgi:nitrogen fixation-related uncharacterized protein